MPRKYILESIQKLLFPTQTGPRNSMAELILRLDGAYDMHHIKFKKISLSTYREVLKEISSAHHS